MTQPRTPDPEAAAMEELVHALERRYKIPTTTYARTLNREQQKRLIEYLRQRFVENH